MRRIRVLQMDHGAGQRIDILLQTADLVRHVRDIDQPVLVKDVVVVLLQRLGDIQKLLVKIMLLEQAALHGQQFLGKFLALAVAQYVLLKLRHGDAGIFDIFDIAADEVVQKRADDLFGVDF